LISAPKSALVLGDCGYLAKFGYLSKFSPNNNKGSFI